MLYDARKKDPIHTTLHLNLGFPEHLGVKLPTSLPDGKITFSPYTVQRSKNFHYTSDGEQIVES